MSANRSSQNIRRRPYVRKKRRKIKRNSLILITILFISVIVSIVITLIALP